MNIELRSLVTYDRMSEETTAFSASLYINGKKVGYAKNDGRGGCTDYGLDNYHDEQAKALIKEAEAYCLTLEPLKMPGVHQGGEPFTIPMNLENFIDQIVDEFWDEKEKKRFRNKMAKDQLTALLIGNDREYKKIFWPVKGERRSLTIASLLEIEKGRKMLDTTIKEYKRMMSPSDRILNTNIPKELL